jgi:hypothetical protein
VATLAGGAADEAVNGSITSFANAQIAGDTAALGALSDHGVPVDGLPRPSRVVVVQVAPEGRDVWRASLRLLVDPSPADPVARSADETLLLRRASASGQVFVANASAAVLGNVSTGPHVVRVGMGSRPGTVTVTYDADIDASSVQGAHLVRVGGGRPVPVETGYDAATRTATVSLPAGASGSVRLLVTTSLTDIAGHHLSAPFQAALTTPGPPPG